jgi:preprotein translocase subunit SecG
MEILLKIAMFVVALFLIVLILLQRGRGGGLAGALGGMGGQSAFGTKAGDMFTRITSGLALFWILLCVLAVKYEATAEDRFDAAAGSKADAGEESIEAQPTKETKTGKAGRATSGGKSSATPAGASDKSNSDASDDGQGKAESGK